MSKGTMLEPDAILKLEAQKSGNNHDIKAASNFSHKFVLVT